MGVIDERLMPELRAMALAEGDARPRGVRLRPGVDITTSPVTKRASRDASISTQSPRLSGEQSAPSGIEARMASIDDEAAAVEARTDATVGMTVDADAARGELEGEARQVDDSGLRRAVVLFAGRGAHTRERGDVHDRASRLGPGCTRAKAWEQRKVVSAG
ncbi:MAG: hypothetical protein R3E53_04385 [Myxococcota bacterium]